MSNHYASIGFAAQDRLEVVQLLRRAAQEGTSEALTDGDRLVRYLDTESGAAVHVVVRPDGQIRAAKPTYHAPLARRVRARVTGLHPDPANPHADLVQIAPVGADYPLAVELEDGARAATRVPFGEEAELEIVAMADALEVYPDALSFLASGMPMGPEAVIPAGLYPTSSDDGFLRPRAAAICTGTVLAVYPELNERGGAGFFHLVVRTFGMELDVVVAPFAIEGPTPQPGMTISGSFWLVARVAAPVEVVNLTDAVVAVDAAPSLANAAGESSASVDATGNDRIGRQRLFGRWMRD